jgi:putative spermidine/putrescine transport system ATP-binding protein
MDEPMAALDALLRARVREELDRLLTSLGITTVIVTHDLDEAMGLGDLIVVMREGAVEQAGSPREIWESPASAFVAGFVGGSNRLEGRLDGDWLRLPGGASVPRALLSGTGRDGLAASALGSDGGAPGGRVSVFFRPDRPRLAPAGGAGMRGTVVSSRFAGGKTRLLVRLELDLELELDGGLGLGAGQGDGAGRGQDGQGRFTGESLVRIELPGSEAVGIGADVGVDVPPESLFLFAEGAGAGYAPV